MERLYKNSFSALLEFLPSGSQYSNQEQFGAQLNTALLPRVFSLVVLRQTFPFLFENVWDKKESITTILTLSAILLLVAVLMGLIHLVFFLVGRDSFLPAFPCLVSFPLSVFYLLSKGTCFTSFLSDMAFLVHEFMLKTRVDIQAMTNAR